MHIRQFASTQNSGSPGFLKAKVDRKKFSASSGNRSVNALGSKQVAQAASAFTQVSASVSSAEQDILPLTIGQISVYVEWIELGSYIEPFGLSIEYCRSRRKQVKAPLMYCCSAVLFCF